MKLPYSPVLIINKDAMLMMKECTDLNFPSVSGNAQEISDALISLNSASLDNPIAVGNISPEVAGRSIENQLLKVLESLQSQAIFFSTTDNFSEVFLSRFVQVNKAVEVKQAFTDSSKSFVSIMTSDNTNKIVQDVDDSEEVEEEEEFEVSKLEEVLRACPSCLKFFLNYKTSSVPSKAKLLQFI
jgi:hypothetical protein